MKRAGIDENNKNMDSKKRLLDILGRFETEDNFRSGRIKCDEKKMIEEFRTNILSSKWDDEYSAHRTLLILKYKNKGTDMMYIRDWRVYREHLTFYIWIYSNSNAPGFQLQSAVEEVIRKLIYAMENIVSKSSKKCPQYSKKEVPKYAVFVIKETFIDPVWKTINRKVTIKFGPILRNNYFILTITWRTDFLNLMIRHNSRIRFKIKMNTYPSEEAATILMSLLQFYGRLFYKSLLL
jgi:hypothetical protein